MLATRIIDNPIQTGDKTKNYSVQLHLQHVAHYA